MRKNILLSALLGAIPFAPTTAQNFGEIHGRVVDSKTREGVAFASVTTWPSGSGPGTETDIDGRFKLKPLEPGTYTLRFSFTGFNTFELGSIEVLGDNITRIGEVTLEGNQLPDLVIVHRRFERPLIDMDNPTVNTLLAPEFEHDPNRKNPTDMIEKNFPGVTKSRDGESLIFRGSRPGSMVYFVDGVKVTGKLSGVPSFGIRSISVYTGALPARYGDVTGGVVVIDTKSYQEEWARRNVEAERETLTNSENIIE
ncbi:MAG: TonB-dependent receptor [Flavobacteriales bacterium]|nr:TonB-dependent receptor [Flavobacteriales bacterium]MBK6943926.1 TonB-dependent receptor [Flavobacteriales bacterium]MBK7240134.1 TonB-dependent receptor [Flavobacteriales bacterium]MBK7297815.1 TonB-dependent receptor [Flavobacteriales bacterium]MBK9533597.1 TonB-dependent receptor [Flavobacteriales bacterium]